MLNLDAIEQVHITTLDVDAQHYNVSVRMAHDGIEYVGHIWFADGSAPDSAFRDHAALPGRTKEEVVALAERLTSDELTRRYARALADKRRYLGLRKLTGEVLHKIRYLNQVAASMRTGLLDIEGAAHEIDLTEEQLHELVAQLRAFAGVEGGALSEGRGESGGGRAAGLGGVGA